MDSLDVGGIVALEHLNINTNDKELSADFFFMVMGLTRDPYDRVGSGTMWVNCGRQQIHVPLSPENVQVVRGTVYLAVPSIEAFRERLFKYQEMMNGTRFAIISDKDASVELYGPHGNHFHVTQNLSTISPAHSRLEIVPFCFGSLGIYHIKFLIPPRTAAKFSRFYEHFFQAPTVVTECGKECKVLVGAYQWLSFVETEDQLQEYDGHHLAIYVSDFSGCFQRLSKFGLNWKNPRFQDKCATLEQAVQSRQIRTLHLVDPEDGERFYELEHEIRPIAHPSYRRALANRTGDFI